MGKNKKGCRRPTRRDVEAIQRRESAIAGLAALEGTVGKEEGASGRGRVGMQEEVGGGLCVGLGKSLKQSWFLICDQRQYFASLYQ